MKIAEDCNKKIKLEEAKCKVELEKEKVLCIAEIRKKRAEAKGSSARKSNPTSRTDESKVKIETEPTVKKEKGAPANANPDATIKREIKDEPGNESRPNLKLEPEKEKLKIKLEPTTNEEKSFMCNQCTSEYRTHSGLKRHAASRHPQTS